MHGVTLLMLCWKLSMDPLSVSASFSNVIGTKRLKDTLFENLVSYKGEVWVQQMETINVSPGFIRQAHPTLIFC